MYKGLLTRNSHYSDFVELTLFYPPYFPQERYRRKYCIHAVA